MTSTFSQRYDVIQINLFHRKWGNGMKLSLKWLVEHIRLRLFKISPKRFYGSRLSFDDIVHNSPVFYGAFNMNLSILERWSMPDLRLYKEVRDYLKNSGASYPSSFSAIHFPFPHQAMEFKLKFL